ncbi:MAG: hypothetical protein MPK75_00750 [Alphaproteobacteria bacterium]|nr:hypothetical protein [Alphaproteobacteria bacterium]
MSDLPPGFVSALEDDGVKDILRVLTGPDNEERRALLRESDRVFEHSRAANGRFGIEGIREDMRRVLAGDDQFEIKPGDRIPGDEGYDPSLSMNRDPREDGA